MPSIHQQKPTTPKKVNSIEEDLWGKSLHHTLLWGLAGSGKTTLASSWPAPILWLICSGMSKPAGLQSINTPEQRKRITPKLISTVAQFTEISQDRDLLAKYAEGTVVVDHIGGFADTQLQEVLGMEEIPLVKNWGMASMDEYRLTSDRLKLSINKLFANTQGKVVVLGHQKLHENKKTPSASFNGVALGISAAEWLHKTCDCVFRCYVNQKYKTLTEGEGEETITTSEKDGVEFRLLLGGDESFATKFQSPKRNIPEYITAPPGKNLTYDQIKKALGV